MGDSPVIFAPLPGCGEHLVWTGVDVPSISHGRCLFRITLMLVARFMQPSWGTVAIEIRAGGLGVKVKANLTSR